MNPLNSQSNGSLTGENLLFLVGCPRSGTTWLQRLLASHPRIRTGPESELFKYIGSQFALWRVHMERVRQGRGGSGLTGYFSDDEFVAVQKQYLCHLLGPMLRGVQPG